MKEAGSSKHPEVALVSGFWGQNIGNAFFNVGGKWLLDQIFGESSVAYIQDQPGYRTFHNQAKGNPPNSLRLLDHLNLKYLVLQGPVFTKNLPHLWGKTMRVMRDKGVRVLYVGAAFFKFNSREFSVVKSFLEEYPPYLIATRDQVSFSIIKSFNLPSTKLVNGIDSAFFVPEAYRPFRIELPPYLVMNFDRRPEPIVRLSYDSSKSSAHNHLAGTINSIAPQSAPLHQVFTFQGHRYEVLFPSLPSWLAKQSKSLAYLGHALDYRRLPDRIGDLLVVRTEHRTNPFVGWKVYKRPNTIASDEPFTYFNVYANAQLVLSDRVHACAVSLAYGRPAMLFSPSPRGALLARVGAAEIRSKPIRLNTDHLAELKEKYIDQLKAILQ